MEQSFTPQPDETSPDDTVEATESNEPTTPMWLRQRIDHATTEALTRHREISQEDAQDIAGALAIELPNDSQLAKFAVTGIGSNQILRDEYLAIYHDQTTPPEVRGWIDWLGSRLIHHNGGNAPAHDTRDCSTPPDLHTIHWPTELTVNNTTLRANVYADLTGDKIAQLEQQLSPLLDEYSTGFSAYLSLPDVNAGSPNLREDFNLVYEGSYLTREEVMFALTELENWESEVEQIVQHSGVDGLIIIDHDVLWDHLETNLYDCVPAGGELHIFNK